MRFLMLLSLLALPAFADQPLVKLQTLDDNRGWEAVGKLVLGDRGFCTGALIAPQLVLTAAHCLFDKDTGAWIDPTQIKFLAGWRNNRAEAYRGVRRAVVDPDYAYGADDSMKRLADDVALIELDQPILRDSVKPFGVADTPNSGDTVAVVSYGQDRADNPSLQQQCTVMDREAGILVMTCDVDFGSSGAPVFQMKDGVPMVVSVISAKAEVQGKRVSLGSVLQIPLGKLMDVLQTGAAPFGAVSDERSLSVGLAGGAKFVKPVATNTP